MKYQVAITWPDGTTVYLSHKCKMQWCQKTASKHAREHAAKFPANKYEVVPA